MCAAVRTEAAAAESRSRTELALRRQAPWARVRRGLGPYLLIAPAAIVLVAVLGYPLWTLASLSLQHYGLRELIAHEGRFVGLANYSGIFSDPVFWTVVVRSVAFTVIAVGLTMVFATLIALLLGHMSRPLQVLLTSGLVFIWAIPPVVAVDIWQWMFDFEFGVVNWTLTALGLGNFIHHNWFAAPLEGFTVITLLVVWGAIPFVTVTLFAALAQIPRELVDSAQVDGANGWQVFWGVTTPILKPIFLILISLSIIWDFQVFTQIWVMLNSRPGSGYFTMAVYSFFESFRITQYGLGSAISVVTVLALLVVTFFYVRQMVRIVEAPL